MSGYSVLAPDPFYRTRTAPMFPEGINCQNEAQAEKAWERLLVLFKRALV